LPIQPSLCASWGNQQKVVLAKWLLVENIQLFIFDDDARRRHRHQGRDLQMIRDLLTAASRCC
jgi:hypothetical protein